MTDNIAFIDLEISGNGKISDIGATKPDGSSIHTTSLQTLNEFIAGCQYLCGHNIVEHDFKYLENKLGRKDYILIDTLYLSPLLFPNKPYHKLLKDDKLDSNERNNPLNDAKKAMALFIDEVSAFEGLGRNLRRIYCSLLNEDSHFNGFFKYLDVSPFFLTPRIKKEFEGLICENVNIDSIAEGKKVELAYALAIIGTHDRFSITPPWVSRRYPEVDTLVHLLRGKGCASPSCPYCSQFLDSRKALKRWFGFDEFRRFEGEPLQQNAVEAAVRGESILSIFPTGGGKSLTFQLPALIAGEASRRLTVVISPLQALMKDQVENLEAKGISDAVFLNGMLSPVERAENIERVREGRASILYIAPEQLRSATIEKLLMSRNIERFVIDEAHCFSAWGQDFRVEYMYIAEFIKSIQQQKGLTHAIPVSCFTATAKPKVISDISDYFDRHLGLQLKKFTTNADRKNLHYNVQYRETDRDKYTALRTLLETYDTPAIVYVSRTRKTEDLATRLNNDGFPALPFHGQMESTVKVGNQDAFMSNKVRIIVATSAFGMGVDKNDVGLVVHYDISDSLENYIQEAGRAGRNEHDNAECYILYNDDDLNKHFILLNQTKLTLNEINQVWRAVKDLTQKRGSVQISAFEIARKAGWEDNGTAETKVKTALAALENAGFVKRGRNCPRVFASSIVPKNYETAAGMIDSDKRFPAELREKAKRIVKSLIGEKYRAQARTEEAESRVDYISDILGIRLDETIACVEAMRECGILTKDTDMTAFLRNNARKNDTVRNFLRLEQFLLGEFSRRPGLRDLKEINEAATAAGVPKSSVRNIRTILLFWTIKGYIVKENAFQGDHCMVCFSEDPDAIAARIEKRADLSASAIARLAEMSKPVGKDGDSKAVFSLQGDLLDWHNQTTIQNPATLEEMKDTLLYLAKTGAITLEGGFMVLYNRLSVERLVMDNKVKYKKDDYRNLEEFYKQRVQQIHIVGEYANLMVKDYGQALEFVKDYFKIEYKAFLKKYFDNNRVQEMSRNISPKKYNAIYGNLTEAQRQIIDDKESRFIMVPAGPGSGKTYILVRKLASLILMEDVKSEQLLMLTFSRAAASEFKRRLHELIGDAARYVEVKTFHSFCFDILGLRGSLDKADNVVEMALEGIRNRTIERSKITKSTLVIDEAQDMDNNEFALVEELIRNNEDIRVIAVGDDDQNIFSFRGSDSANMGKIGKLPGAASYDLLDNFRSDRAIVKLANTFTVSLSDRIKSRPIVAHSYAEGSVSLICHTCGQFAQAVVNDVLRCPTDSSTCVLTNTNDDAALLVALLNASGRKARLIQSNNGFALCNLKEIRDIISMLKQWNSEVYIRKDNWETVTKSILQRYKDSSNLPIIKKLFKDYKEEYQSAVSVSDCETVGFVSDFENFVLESSMEDFEENPKDTVIVSTIHKSKGKEFDNVFILYKGLNYNSDKDGRALYVGLTRARHNLTLHFNGYIFPRRISGIKIDRNEYPQPETAVMQLGHKDVILDFFKGKAELILGLDAGDELTYNDGWLISVKNGRKVAKLSAAAMTNVNALRSKGYVPTSATVRCIVWWQFDDDRGEHCETPILLADLELITGADPVC